MRQFTSFKTEKRNFLWFRGSEGIFHFIAQNWKMPQNYEVCKMKYTVLLKHFGFVHHAKPRLIYMVHQEISKLVGFL